VEINLSNQSAALQVRLPIHTVHGQLQINDIDEDDFGEYRCEVGNGKATSSHTIFLREANPPEQLHVSLEQVRPHSLLWKLTEEKDVSTPPLIYIRIEYIRKARLDAALV
jgi:hypothetical protein